MKKIKDLNCIEMRALAALQNERERKFQFLSDVSRVILGKSQKIPALSLRPGPKSDHQRSIRKTQEEKRDRKYIKRMLIILDS